MKINFTTRQKQYNKLKNELKYSFKELEKIKKGEKKAVTLKEFLDEL